MNSFNQTYEQIFLAEFIMKIDFPNMQILLHTKCTAVAWNNFNFFAVAVACLSLKINKKLQI